MSPRAVAPALDPDDDDVKYFKDSKATSVTSASGTSVWRLLPLALVVVWQLHTLNELTTYEEYLRESRNKHHELQLSLVQIHSNSSDCITKQREKAATVSLLEQKLRQQEAKMEEMQDLNNWLNQTATARDTSLRAEQAMRVSLESSVQGLKEQMNLMQGQLITAQQQQGTLHSGRGKKHH